MDHAEPAAMPQFTGNLESKSKFYPSVQGLRGFAAMSVFCLHLYLMALHGGFFPHFPPFVEGAWSTLGNGVGLFFIISGFVIPASLVRHGNIRQFIKDRVLRIMPLFTLLHLIVFTVGPFIGYKWMRGIDLKYYAELFLANLTFTALPFGLPLAQQNAWTLTYEWLFYIVVGVIWLVAKQKNRDWLNPSILIIAILLSYWFPPSSFFILGMAFARFRLKIRLNRILELLFLPVCLIAYYYEAQFGSTYAALLPAAILFLAVIGNDTIIARSLSTRIPQYLGKISYSLYLVHPFAVFPFQIIGSALTHRGFYNEQVFSLYLICSIPTTLVLSTLSYYLVEVKLRNIIAQEIRFSWFCSIWATRLRF